MKSFENIDVKSVREAVGLLQKFHQQKKTAAVVGGGSEYLQLMKDHVVEPDYLINLKTIPGLDYIKEERGGFRIGALAKLADIERSSGNSREIAGTFRCGRGSCLTANSQRRDHRRQYLSAAVLLVFSFVELHLSAQRRSALLHGDGR